MERKTEDMRKVVTGNKFVDLATLIFDDARCVWCGVEFENGGASAGKDDPTQVYLYQRGTLNEQSSSTGRY